MTKNMEDTLGVSITDQTNTGHVDPFGNLPIYNPPQPAWQMPIQQPVQWFNPENYQVTPDNPTFETTLLGRKVKTKPGQNIFESGTIMGVIVNSICGIITVSVIVYSVDTFHTSLLTSLTLEEPI